MTKFQAFLFVGTVVSGVLFTLVLNEFKPTAVSEQSVAIKLVSAQDGIKVRAVYCIQGVRVTHYNIRRTKQGIENLVTGAHGIAKEWSSTSTKPCDGTEDASYER